MTSHISILGLGPMGHAIARSLLNAGHPTTVWNRSPDKAMPLERHGAQLAPTPAAAIDGAAFAILSLRGNDAAAEVLNAAGPVARGTIVVNLSSDTPRSARELAIWAADRGVRYLGGTMLTPSSMVGLPGSTAVVAGDASVFEIVRPALLSVAPELTLHGDDPGVVAALDLALLDAFWTTVAGWSHAVALGRSEGLSASVLTERLAAIVSLAAQVGAGISHDADTGTYPGDISTITSAHSTLRHILQASHERDLDTGIPTAITTLLAQAITSGHGTDGPSRLVPTIQEPRHPMAGQGHMPTEPPRLA